jgi:hypothetical protein
MQLSLGSRDQVFDAEQISLWDIFCIAFSVNIQAKERGLTMSDSKTCSRCGGTTLETGRLQSTGRMSFYFDDPRFLTALTGYVPIFSTMCLDCGTIDLSGEISKARKISKKE